MVLVPLVILAGLLRVANGRAKAKLAEQREAEASAAPGEPVEDS